MAREGAWPEEGLVLRFTQSKVPFRGRLNVGGKRYKDLGGRSGEGRQWGRGAAVPQRLFCSRGREVPAGEMTGCVSKDAALIACNHMVRRYFLLHNILAVLDFHCSMWALHWAAQASLVGARALLLCLSTWDLSSQTRDGTHVPSIRRQIPNHWTISEVPFNPCDAFKRKFSIGC